MMSAPPFTPGEARLESASAATLVPTIDFQVTAPRSGSLMEAASMAAAAASLVQVPGALPISAGTFTRSNHAPRRSLTGHGLYFITEALAEPSMGLTLPT